MTPKTRSPVATICVLLRTAEQRNRAQALLANMPLDLANPPEVVFREQSKGRGLDANAYYWMRLGEIAAQAWVNGRQFDADCWHEYAKSRLMPDQITLKSGETVSKYRETPDGKTVVISTTKLERKCFADYVTTVEAYAAQELGVEFSARP